jgi:hypothetical protein
MIHHIVGENVRESFRLRPADRRQAWQMVTGAAPFDFAPFDALRLLRVYDRTSEIGEGRAGEQETGNGALQIGLLSLLTQPVSCRG